MYGDVVILVNHYSIAVRRRKMSLRMGGWVVVMFKSWLKKGPLFKSRQGRVPGKAQVTKHKKGRLAIQCVCKTCSTLNARSSFSMDTVLQNL